MYEKCVKKYVKKKIGILDEVYYKCFKLVLNVKLLSLY